MSELTTIRIAQLWGAAFAADKFLTDFAKRYFEKVFMIQVGADMRRPPDDADAPFLAIFPDAAQTGPQRAKNSHELGLVAGIVDEEWLDESGVKTMRGLVRLNELCPLLEKAMRNALPKARVQDIDLEYEILAYPLFLANYSITVEESLPVGGR
jgi:hypothetical protein